MFHYDVEKLKAAIGEVIVQHITPYAWDWLQTKITAPVTGAGLNAAFAAMPRKTGRTFIKLNNSQSVLLAACRKGFSIENWSVDRLARVWLLLQLDAGDQEKYHRNIESLFLAAEMNELVALYSSLPLLAYPERWVQRCSEGIRSNIGGVLEAIMYRNSYPSENMGQPAWNQLVLKAFFTDKRVELIIGLDDRANKELAYTLTDYARERWAAGRKTDPMLWRLVGRFIDGKILGDINMGIGKQDKLGQEAIALAITETDYEPAKILLKENAGLSAATEGKKLTWASFTHI